MKLSSDAGFEAGMPCNGDEATKRLAGSVITDCHRAVYHALKYTRLLSVFSPYASIVITILAHTLIDGIDTAATNCLRRHLLI